MDPKKVLPPESAAATIFNRFAAEIGNGGLAEETRRVCILVTLAACGGKEAFAEELKEALGAGLSPLAAHEAVLQSAANLRVGNGAQMLKELVLQMLPYIGYPRALNALACLRNACGN